MNSINKIDSGFRPRVLVLMATYNGAAWLVEQIKSVLAQQDVDVHILIGDDFSKDKTRDFIEINFSGNSAVKLMAWESSSGAAGANFRRLYLAADVGNYDFIALADQDDIWLPLKLITGIRCLNETGFHGYSGAVEAFWPDGRKKILAQVPVLKPADFLFEGAGQGCTFVVRAELFLRIQQFCRAYPTAVDALHYHDWLIYLLARAWNKEWYFDPLPLILYRQHGGNEIGSRDGIAAVKKRLNLIRSGWYRGQVRAAFSIYQQANGNDSIALNIGQLISQRPVVMRGGRLFFMLLRHGRRRFVDRLVLALAAVIAWL